MPLSKVNSFFNQLNQKLTVSLGATNCCFASGIFINRNDAVLSLVHSQPLYLQPLHSSSQCLIAAVMLRSVTTLAATLSAIQGFVLLLYLSFLWEIRVNFSPDAFTILAIVHRF